MQECKNTVLKLADVHIELKHNVWFVGDDQSNPILSDNLENFLIITNELNAFFTPEHFTLNCIATLKVFKF